MTARRVFISLAGLLIVGTVLTRAQDTASLHFPSDSNCTGPNTCNVLSAVVPNDTMDITVVAAGVPNVKTNPAFTIHLATGDTGPVVAAKAANAICNTAVAIGRPLVRCSGFITGTGGCTDAACCGSATTSTLTLSCLGQDGTGTGFDLSRSSTSDSITISPDGPGANIQNLMSRTHVGNSTGADFQQLVFVQFLFSGTSAQYQLLFTTGQPSPTIVSVNFPAECTDSTSCNNLLANRVRTAFSSTNPSVLQGAQASSRGLDPGLVDPTQSFIEFTPVSSFTRVTGNVTPDREFMIGTGDPPPPVPTLSPLGMAVVAVLILLSGLWLLRRRQPRVE